MPAKPYCECAKKRAIFSRRRAEMYHQRTKINSRKELKFKNRSFMSKRDRQIVLLEWLAATSIFAIVAIVLYMVFEYRPA